MTVLTVIILLIGALIGFSAGLFGIGGALIATPLLNILAHLPPMLALATPLPTALPSAIAGTIAYHREGLIEFRVVRYVLVGALPASLLGTWLTQFVQGNAMMIATGAFMLLVGGTFFVRGWLLGETAVEELRLQPATLVMTGIVAGFIAGFLAIGGGLVLVPMFVRFNKMRFKQATATSLFCIAVLSIPATLGHWALGHIDWGVAVLLALASTPMSFLGARAAITMRNRTLERVYGTFMIGFAVYFLWRIM